MPKATLRKNGTHMLTLRTEHHLDMDLAAAALAAWSLEWGEPLPESRAAVLNALRVMLRRVGEDDLEFVHERWVEDDEWNEVQEKATRALVAYGLFPAETDG